MRYTVKVKLTGREVTRAYQYSLTRLGVRLGFTRRMMDLVHSLNGQAVGIYWTSRWVEKAR